MKVYTVIVEYSNDYDTGGFDFIGTKRSLDDAKTLAAEWYKQYVEQGVERARKQYVKDLNTHKMREQIFGSTYRAKPPKEPDGSDAPALLWYDDYENCDGVIWSESMSSRYFTDDNTSIAIFVIFESDV